MGMVASLHSLSSLAVETGRNIRTISKALKGVKPDGELKGKPAWFLTTALTALEGDPNVMNPAREKARLDGFKADIAEIELATLKGDRVPRGQVRDMIQRCNQIVRTKLFTVASKVAPLLKDKLSTAQKEEIVRRAIDEALSELSSLERAA